MGKGDKKTPKGKRSAGSYGNARPHDAGSKAAVKGPAKAGGKTTVAKTAAKPAVKAPARTVVKKAAAPAKKV